jgi:hypothetical protein
MSQRKLVEVVNYLHSLHVAGVPIVTFNGLGFDWRVICDNVGEDNLIIQTRVRDMARGHHDIMLKYTCEYGYFVSLQSFLDLSNSGLSTTGSGKDVITKWCGEQATHQSQLDVLDGCRNNIQCLSHVYSQLWNPEPIKRKTKSGNTQIWDHGGKVDTVQVCVEKFIANPLENSWLRNPPDPAQMMEWATTSN